MLTAPWTRSRDREEGGVRDYSQWKLTESHPVLSEAEAQEDAGSGGESVEGSVEYEVPHQGEGGQLGGLGEEEEGGLGLQEGGDDAPRVAVDHAEEVDGQGVGLAQLLRLPPQAESGRQAEDGAGADPKDREDRGGVQHG